MSHCIKPALTRSRKSSGTWASCAARLVGRCAAAASDTSAIPSRAGAIRVRPDRAPRYSGLWRGCAARISGGRLVRKFCAFAAASSPAVAGKNPPAIARAAAEQMLAARKNFTGGRDVRGVFGAQRKKRELSCRETRQPAKNCRRTDSLHQREQFLVGARGWLMRWIASKFFNASTLGNGGARRPARHFWRARRAAH